MRDGSDTLNANNDQGLLADQIRLFETMDSAIHLSRYGDCKQYSVLAQATSEAP